ncbi:hypothetical protein CALVIDRAFT_233068 [Calocera viscosa TUFC12733]|uniref:Uncharacterized protein n=1 Tax=Calocera viscosa (strain TUFC12733) TaxID=1330018 RepID=A0A167JYI4_CALVF|nr:hypothetical protein CALVIDRAFT_233068 [Calocera viscosa TUFC12733]
MNMKDRWCDCCPLMCAVFGLECCATRSAGVGVSPSCPWHARCWPPHVRLTLSYHSSTSDTSAGMHAYSGLPSSPNAQRRKRSCPHGPREDASGIRNRGVDGRAKSAGLVLAGPKGVPFHQSPEDSGQPS